MKTSVTQITRQSWGTSKGQPVFLFRMENASGAFIELTNFGASLVTVAVPDKRGRVENVILGFQTLEGYEHDVCCIGSTIGRFANRIGGATFSLDGVTYDLDRNDGNNTNHGGSHGFHKRIFDAKVHDDAVVFTLTSKDGDGGFPGKVLFATTYKWSDDNQLTIQHNAETDKPTIVSFTNHAYFNLTCGRDKVHRHQLAIKSDLRLEIRSDYIPTGTILAAGDLKFTGEPVESKYTSYSGVITGLNSYFLFDQGRSTSDAVCSLWEESSGRHLTVFTTYPGVQLYTGDFLNSIDAGNNGRPHEPFDGLCLECQYCPDSPNHPDFPSTRLEPGETFSHQIIYKFSLTEGI